MPSNRRFKVTILLLLTFGLVLFYISSAARQTRSSQFYTSTSDALAQRAEEERDGKALESDDLEVHRRLKAAEEAAKKAADKKGHEFHGDDVKSAAEKVKADVESARVASSVTVGGRPRKVLNGGGTEKILMEGDDKNEAKKTEPESVEAHEAKEEMNYILKRSPIIIFSKTYCPFSKKAKDILLNRYKITPTPHVVELDEHPLGGKLQEELSHTTGRRTVPNILINGKSIGGGDELEELHESGNLEDTVRSMGGKRVQISRAMSSRVNRET